MVCGGEAESLRIEEPTIKTILYWLFLSQLAIGVTTIAPNC
jgi:hypothetical protein